MAQVKATRRSERGTRRVRPLRAAGNIPGIIYGHGEEALPITLARHDVELALLHGERLLEVDVEGRRENVLIKEVQYDALGSDLLHVDLTRVRLDERVEVTVPIVLRGTPAGAAEGGVLSQTQAAVRIECVVTSIPEEIRVPVAALKVGDVLKRSDLPLPDGATLLDDPETVVCTVSVIAEEEVVEAPAEQAPAQPEVIGEKKQAEGETPPAEKE